MSMKMGIGFIIPTSRSSPKRGTMRDGSPGGIVPKRTWPSWILSARLPCLYLKFDLGFDLIFDWAPMNRHPILAFAGMGCRFYISLLQFVFLQFACNGGLIQAKCPGGFGLCQMGFHDIFQDLPFKGFHHFTMGEFLGLHFLKQGFIFC